MKYKRVMVEVTTGYENLSDGKELIKTTYIMNNSNIEEDTTVNDETNFKLTVSGYVGSISYESLKEVSS